jgi:hypothetical protein
MATASGTQMFRPIIHAGYMIQEILMQKNRFKGQWWVVWYNHETKASCGMESFESFDDASEWNEKNPPRKIDEGDFGRSTIIFSG